jgi:DNA-binding CsgD family transcriptional regulator
VLDVLRPYLAMRYRTAGGRRVGESSGLTAREREILEFVAEGKTNGQIAEQLWISTGTVRRHLENAYAKLGVHTRTAAVRAASLA